MPPSRRVRHEDGIALTNLLGVDGSDREDHGDSDGEKEKESESETRAFLPSRDGGHRCRWPRWAGTCSWARGRDVMDRVVDVTWVVKTSVLRVVGWVDEWAVSGLMRWVDGDGDVDARTAAVNGVDFCGGVEAEMEEFGESGVDFDAAVAGGDVTGDGRGGGGGPGWGWIGRVDVLERLYAEGMGHTSLQ